MEALQLAATFKSAVDLLVHIQTDRQKEHYNIAKLRLDLIVLRLHRWGQSVNIYNEPGRPFILLSESDVEKAERILTSILDIVQKAKNLPCGPYEKGIEEFSVSAKISEGVSSKIRKNELSLPALNEKMKELEMGDLKDMTPRKKIKWMKSTLSRNKESTRLVEDAADLVDDLETILPATTTSPLSDIDEVAPDKNLLVKPLESLERNADRGLLTKSVQEIRTEQTDENMHSGHALELSEPVDKLHDRNFSIVRQLGPGRISFTRDDLVIHQDGSGDIAVTGNRVVVHQNGSGNIIVTGNDAIIHQNGSGCLMVTGDGIIIHQNGTGNILVTGDGIVIHQLGSGSILVAGIKTEIYQYGSGNVMVKPTITNDTLINQYGSGEVSVREGENEVNHRRTGKIPVPQDRNMAKRPIREVDAQLQDDSDEDENNEDDPAFVDLSKYITESMSEMLSEIEEEGVGESHRASSSGRIPFTATGRNDLLSQGFEKIDKPKKFFTRGRIFKAPWIETAGPTTKDVRNTTDVRYGQKAYTDIRRFVVLRKKQDSCICAPIHTFGGRGGGKRSTRPQEYALIFAISKDEVWDKERLSRKEIPMVVERDDVNVTYPQARIQFGKLYSVEFSTTVQRLGYVHKEALDALEGIFRESLKLESGDAETIGTSVNPEMTSSVTSIAADGPGPGTKASGVVQSSVIQQGKDLIYRGENMDPSTFRQYPEYEFKRGRIFKTEWFEPSVSSPDHASSSKAYTAIRRFLIIKEPRGKKAASYCLCLPISTNAGQGTLHRRAIAEDHAVIYTDTKQNTLLAGETIMKRAIRMIPTPQGKREKLDPTSRLNYGKIYTIECNVRIGFIGEVDLIDWETVVSDFNSVNPPLEHRE